VERCETQKKNFFQDDFSSEFSRNAVLDKIKSELRKDFHFETKLHENSAKRISTLKSVKLGSAARRFSTKLSTLVLKT
jgi:hypothetical protein